MKKKRILSGTVISIVLAVVAIVIGLSSTSALFVKKDTSKRVNNYNTGILSITAVSKSDTISLDNTLPMSDELGIETTPYTFTIKNNGNVDYQFDVQLLATSENTFDSQYIKLKIDDDAVTTLGALTNSKIKSQITLAAQETMDISIRIWLASNTPNSQIGKSFISQLVINGIAVSTASNYGVSAATYIANLYNNAAKTVVTNNNIDYNYATTTSLMNDRLGGTTKDLNAGNIRYYGTNPSNYIDIGHKNKSTNEPILYRIIGVFDNMLKVIAVDSIGQYSWDTSELAINSGFGVNEWTESDLMKLLNLGNDSDSANNSLYWNADSGNCYNGNENYITSCDFINIGLSDDVKNKIATVTWNLGASNDTGGYPNTYYSYERGTTHVENPVDGVTREDTWIGKVGLIYPSDYGYAANFNNCTTSLDNYNSSECTSNNWLYNSTSQRTIFSDSSNPEYVWIVQSTGGLNKDVAGNGTYNIYPVFYLNADESIASGTGTNLEPYVLR